MTPNHSTLPRILCVDDDSNLLAALVRSLRRRYHLDVALGPEIGLARMADNGPYAVVVSDMNMPGMSGVQFLGHAREIAPNAVRMMLTGNADLQTAVDALHQGYVFRFLIKPIAPEALAGALDAGLAQYRLITAERDLLEKTLYGSIRVLVEILSTVEPDSFEQAQALRRNMRVLARTLGEESTWEMEMAALLSRIGLVTIPTTLVRRARAGNTLTTTEKDVLRRVPEVGARLLANIPRLESVSQAIRYGGKNFDGGGFPADSVRGQDLPLASRLLRVLTDIEEIGAGGLSRAGALAVMRRHDGRYDPRVLAAAAQCFAPAKEAPAVPTERASVGLPVGELRAGQVLAKDVQTPDGKLLIGAGRRLTEPLLERLQNYTVLGLVLGPVRVECEVECPTLIGYSP